MHCHSLTVDLYRYCTVLCAILCPRTPAVDTRLMGGYAEAVTRAKALWSSSSASSLPTALAGWRRTAQRKRQLGGDRTSGRQTQPCGGAPASARQAANGDPGNAALGSLVRPAGEL
ncbi:hypothetical protein VTN96DRAFT_4093 [Rasamsonia emersonii]